MDFNPLDIINSLNNAIGHDTASVLEFLHITDPAVKPDGVREVARKWQALARTVEDSSRDAHDALNGVVWEGKAADAFAQRTRKVQNQAGDIAGALHQGSAAIGQFADVAEGLIDEIGKIAAELIEFEVAGLALSVITAGFSEAASTIAAGERAMKIVELVGKIEEEGSILGRAIKAVTEAIRGLDRALEALKDIKGVASVAKMAKDGMAFSAFSTALEDPKALTDPGKLTDILAEGALAGVGFGVLGKALGKGLKAVSPAALAGLSKTLCKLDDLIPERSILRPSGEDGIRASIANTLKRFKQDPIDVVTGEMLLAQTDVNLSGVLPLVLQRTHLSSYRHGGWFGRSWASTLDQRLQLDEHGVLFATADGLRLCYPIPQPGVPAYPERGPRWPLSWDGRPGGRMHITDSSTGRTYVFAHPVHTKADGVIDLPLHAIEDRNGNTIRIVYSVGEVPVEIRHHGGYRIAIDRHPHQPRITALRLLDTDGPGTSTTLVRYGYDNAGHLTEVINSSGKPLRFTYDHAGRVTSWTDRNNTSYAYTYDAQGRCIRGEGSDGFQSGTFVYDDAHRTTYVTNALGHTTTVVYNEAYRPIQETDPLGNTTVTEWDADNEHVVAVTDPLGRTTRYRHDAAGNLASLTRPDGSVATAAYNDLCLPMGITEPGGQVWRHTYDERGNRLTTTDPVGARTEYAYDASGNLIAVTDALGHTRRVTNNPAGLPVSLTDPLGHVNTSSRDAFGRITTLTDALGNITRFGWTVEGKPAWRELPDGSRETWQWDGEGNLTSHTDAVGHTTSYQPTHFDLPASRTTANGVTYRFTYDTELNLTRVTNPNGQTWEYVYDPAGRLISETDFNGRTLTYTHDLAGQLITRTNGAGETITFTRDILGRVTEQRSSDGNLTTFTYDPAGRLVRSANAHTEIARECDAAGRTLAETVNGRRTAYTYDALGRRTHRTTPTGVVSTWTYDAAGLPQFLAADGHTLAFTHDALSRETARSFGTGVTLAQSWDRASRLTAQSLTHSPDGERTLLQHREYAYRPDGFLTEIEELTTGRRRFDLDPTGRVTAVHARDWTETYAYNTLGNLTQTDDSAHEFTGTLLRRSGRTRYEYDAQGRVIRTTKRLLNGQTRTQLYTWNAEDQLTETVTPDGTRWYYQYDPAGRRTAKQRLTPDGQVAEEIRFTWDGTRLAEQTRSDGHITTWDYAPGTHRPLTQLDRDLTQAEVDARFHAIVTDLVGTPTELVTPDGTLTWHHRTTLWGTPTPAATDTDVDCPLRFPGQYSDPETGWNYNYFRHYDPEAAGYTAPDPLGLAPGSNHHAYASNVYAEIDPLGLFSCTDEGAGATDEIPRTLYHYTNEQGYNNILKSGELKPSLKENNPKDARYGDGQYLTDVEPGTRTPGQLSYAFLRVPWAGGRFTHYIEIDATGLNVIRGREHVFVVPNQEALDIASRIVSHGKN
ncbi:MAG: hypothetical protein JO362_24590 [Streptomycetaceae bacterium]|nr:hypothetical protein [Streptomycetaceae bacterium]